MPQSEGTKEENRGMGETGNLPTISPIHRFADSPIRSVIPLSRTW
jgi:hypothetical protein